MLFPVQKIKLPYDDMRILIHEARDMLIFQKPKSVWVYVKTEFPRAQSFEFTIFLRSKSSRTRSQYNKRFFFVYPSQDNWT